MIEADYQIYRLSDIFRNDYTEEAYPEILQKKTRSYNCLLFQAHNEYYVCIPYRTEMYHKYGYHFRSSARARKHKSGLDYSKMIIVKNADYLDESGAVVDNDEYIETVEHIEEIKEDSLKYLNDYIAHVSGYKVLHGREFERKYRYTTLKYFHQELGIKE